MVDNDITQDQIDSSELLWAKGGSRNTLYPQQIAKTILDGFEKHYRIFLDITRGARRRFEQADWLGEREASKVRITLYTQRITEATEKLQQRFRLDEVDEDLWREVKLRYIGLLYEHKQPELAETFYNSVFTYLFDRRYYHNDNIFVRPGVSTDYLENGKPTYYSFYPISDGLSRSARKILLSFKFDLPYADLNRDVRRLVQRIRQSRFRDILFRRHFQIQVISSLFYRNKAAYIVGRSINGPQIIPFVIPLLNNEKGGVYVDSLVTDGDDIANLFSFARAYFMVDTLVPAAVIGFLRTMLPTKTAADLYMAIGLQKQGKSEFYRDFLHHLRHSTDLLEIAPGAKGMVMSVFTLPSYPFVFKVINDKFPPPKETTRKKVMQKYQQVKMHDRVGRMADTLEFSYAAFPLDRFSSELMDELKEKIPNSLEFEDDMVVIRHMYIERRLDPLNIYVEQHSGESLEDAVIGYGNAIKQLAAANIFPGDLLFKNFGVSRHGRVIFYDYDEIELMTDCHFRKIPPPRFPEDELAAEPWYSVGPRDIFPEEFPPYLLRNAEVERIFMKHHADLFDVEYWRGVQEDIRADRCMDIFPYSQEVRFKNVYAKR